MDNEGITITAEEFYELMNRAFMEWIPGEDNCWRVERNSTLFREQLKKLLNQPNEEGIQN